MNLGTSLVAVDALRPHSNWLWGGISVAAVIAVVLAVTPPDWGGRALCRPPGTSSRHPPAVALPPS